MTREHVLMVLGALVLLSPWSGIPMEWLQWALLLIGLAIIAVAFMMRRQGGRNGIVPTATLTPLPPQSEPQPRSSHIAFS